MGFNDPIISAHIRLPLIIGFSIWPFYLGAASSDKELSIGGLFPLHNKVNETCSGAISPRAVQGVEAMFYVVDKINEDASLHLDYTLKGSLFDTCGDGTYASEELVNHYIAVQSGSARPVVGLIGPASYEVAHMISPFLSTLEVNLNIHINKWYILK